MKEFRAEWSGNDCYLSMLYLMSCRLISKDIKIKVNRTMILLVGMGVKLISGNERGTQANGIRELGAGVDSWPIERRRNKGVHMII